MGSLRQPILIVRYPFTSFYVIINLFFINLIIHCNVFAFVYCIRFTNRVLSLLVLVLLFYRIWVSVWVCTEELSPPVFSFFAFFPSWLTPLWSSCGHLWRTSVLYVTSIFEKILLQNLSKHHLHKLIKLKVLVVVLWVGCGTLWCCCCWLRSDEV